MQRRFRRAIVSTLLTAFFLYFGGTTIAAFAQVGRGTIAGRVTDASGAVLHGARVEILQRNSFVGSDAQGEFTFTDLLPGSYTVTVSYVGFRPSNRDVTVAAGQIAPVDAVLKVASAGKKLQSMEDANRAKSRRSIANAPPTIFCKYCPSR